MTKIARMVFMITVWTMMSNVVFSTAEERVPFNAALVLCKMNHTSEHRVISMVSKFCDVPLFKRCYFGCHQCREKICADLLCRQYCISQQGGPCMEKVTEDTITEYGYHSEKNCPRYKLVESRAITRNFGFGYVWGCIASFSVYLLNCQ